MRVNWWRGIACHDCCASVSASSHAEDMMVSHTSLISVKDTGQTNEVNGHSELCIRLDVEWLLS